MLEKTQENSSKRAGNLDEIYVVSDLITQIGCPIGLTTTEMHSKCIQKLENLFKNVEMHLKTSKIDFKNDFNAR